MFIWRKSVTYLSLESVTRKKKRRDVSPSGTLTTPSANPEADGVTLPSSETSVSDKSACLSSASQPVQQEIDKEVLNPAAKIVEKIVNPVKKDENLSESDELFRDGNDKDASQKLVTFI